MAKYRILIPRFWVDPKTRDLTRNQKLMFAHIITGIEACTQTSTGIFEIHRSNFQNYLDFSMDEVDEAMSLFNQKGDLLRYDLKTHMIFVKSFFKHNRCYKKFAEGLMDDFEETYNKAPDFWQEFVSLYRKHFVSLVEKIAKSDKIPLDQKKQQVDFLEMLGSGNLPDITSEKSLKISSSSTSISQPVNISRVINKVINKPQYYGG